MSTPNHDAAREAARHNDGRFGTQRRAEADVDLSGAPQRSIYEDETFSDAWFSQPGAQQRLSAAKTAVEKVEKPLARLLPGSRRRIASAQRRLRLAQSGVDMNERIISSYRDRHPDTFKVFERARAERAGSATA